MKNFKEHAKETAEGCLELYKKSYDPSTAPYAAYCILTHILNTPQLLNILEKDFSNFTKNGGIYFPEPQ